MSAGLATVLDQNEEELLSKWIAAISKSLGSKKSLVPDAALRGICHDFLMALRQGLMKDGADLPDPAWASMRDMLTNLSRQRALQGFTPTETAMFVFSLKSVLFDSLRQQGKLEGSELAAAVLSASDILDKLGLFTTQVYQETREGVILRQQQEMLELSTPVVELWQGILALPLIGTLDSARTQVVMQNLLEAIVARSADLAIIDITGVPTVDTMVAQHLLKAVAAARLMGADCIISGIRPQIAQTIIHLGVDLGSVLTKANLADAFRLALRKKNLTITAQ